MMAEIFLGSVRKKEREVREGKGREGNSVKQSENIITFGNEVKNKLLLN